MVPMLAAALGCGEGGSSRDRIALDRGPQEPPCADHAASLGDLERGRLSSGSACFRLDLEAGEAVRLEVEQIDADLMTTIEDPAGKTILTFDTPVGMEAPERPCFVASARGRHLLHLKSFGAPDAEYSLRLLLRRPATVEDSACSAAAQRFVVASDRFHQEGSSAEAVQGLESAAELWGRAGEHLSESMAHREAARALEPLGRFRQAEGQLRRALEAARVAESSYLELSVLNRLGLILLDRAEIDEAASVFGQALKGARTARDRRAEASALNNLSLVDETRGDVSQAIDRLREAADIQKELAFPGDLSRTLENLAANLALQDYHREALDQLEQALELARESRSLDSEAHCNLELGWVHRLRGAPEEALSPIGEALRLWRSVGDLPGQATALDRLGTALSEGGDRHGALKAFRDSLKISQRIASPVLEAPTLVNLGCLYQELGESDLAWQLLRQARRSSWHLLDAKARSHVHYCSARLSEQTGDLPGALGRIEAALEIVEGMKGLSRRQGARHRPIWLWQDYAELRVSLLVALAEESSEPALLSRAFSAADHTRARSLFEMVLESLFPGEAGPGEPERALRRGLQLLGERRRRLLASNGPDFELEVLEAELSETVLELAAAVARRRASDDSALSSVALAQVSLGEVQAFLPAETLLLRYFLTPRESFLFAVGTDSLTLHRLPGRTIVEAHAEAFHRALRDSSLSPQQAKLLSFSTGRMLLPDGVVPDGTETLLVVADGALHYVPFSALPVPASAGQSPDDDELLVDRFHLRYLPSAAVGVALDQRAKARVPAPKSLKILADAVFSRADDRLGGGAATSAGADSPDRWPRGPLPRLEATAVEAASILQRLPPRERHAVLGFEASKEAFLDPSMADFRILHLATHAFVDERFPEFSGLVFSRHRADGEAVQGDVYLHEILGLRLRADLTVLSGCQTALGRKVRGDGLLGLTRGFFHAGCSQVLVSLWSVDDQATAALMAEFYRALLVDRQNATGALRTAQRWMRLQGPWSRPFYWAPFVLQGVQPPH